MKKYQFFKSSKSKVSHFRGLLHYNVFD